VTSVEGAIQRTLNGQTAGEVYQRDEIVQRVHVQGDLLRLANAAPTVPDSETFVLGVHFIAETAGIHASDGRR
jgi:quinolinate synthase